MKSKISLLCRILAAGILFQTLFFKFSGAPESVFIFTRIGIEPWGRWLSGVSELIAGVLLLVPLTQEIGAVLAVGIMGGALMSHLTILGIEVQGDGGLLFTLALAVLVCSIVVVWLQRERLISRVRLVLRNSK